MLFLTGICFVRWSNWVENFLTQTKIIRTNNKSATVTMPKFFHNLQQHQRSTRVQQSWILAGFALTIIALLTRRPPFSFEQDDNTIRNLTSLYGMVEQSPQQQSSSSSSSSSSITTETTVPTHQPLCYQQSGGFFRDISDSNWKRLQEITKRTFPNHYTPDLMKYANHPTKQHSNWWNAENFQEEFHCQFAERLPSDSSGDGPKWVCDPHRIVQQYQNVTNNNNNMNDKNTNCLIYSVGSNGNVMFEKAVKQQISPDCEIHTFDMVTYNKRNGDFKEALEGYATFHDWGIGRPGPVEGGYLNSMTGNLKTLEETVKLLGHQGRRIDVFKIGTYSTV